MVSNPAKPTPTRELEAIWREYDAIESRLSAPLSERMVQLARLRRGDHVLDLASGRGDPALHAATHVGETGSVTAVDREPGLLRMAEEKARKAGLNQMRFIAADAAELEPQSFPLFDAVFVRWGLMYMEAPVSVLGRARVMMRPGARLVLALWAEPERVAYYRLPRQVLSRYRSLPAIDFDLPGPFRYADLERLRRDLEAGGFSLCAIEEMEVPVMEAENADALLAWAHTFGLAALLEPLSEAKRHAWAADFIAAAKAYEVDGCVRLGGTSRIVVATPGDVGSISTQV